MRCIKSRELRSMHVYLRKSILIYDHVVAAEVFNGK